MHFVHRMLVVFGVAALEAFAAHAQTALDSNLTATIGNYYPIAGDVQPIAGPLANSFSTGSASGVLTDVKVYLERMADPFGSFTMALYASSGNYPSTRIQVLGTLEDASVSANGGIYDFPVIPGLPLTANTRYFIALSANHTGSEATSTYWATTESTAGAGKIAAEYNCFEGFFRSKSQPNIRIGLLPHGETSLGCFPNSSVNDSFLMSVTVSPSAAPAVSAPPRLPLPTTAFTLLMAASAALFLRRSVFQRA
jgi:hypothetical protein